MYICSSPFQLYPLLKLKDKEEFWWELYSVGFALFTFRVGNLLRRFSIVRNHYIRA